MHPNVSCWQTPCGTLNGTKAGGPPTAPKLHKISVITLSTSPLPQIPHRRSKQATASQGFGLKSIFPKDLCFRWEKASFVSQQKKAKESDYHTLGFFYYCHCSLTHILLLEHASYTRCSPVLLPIFAQIHSCFMQPYKVLSTNSRWI